MPVEFMVAIDGANAARCLNDPLVAIELSELGELFTGETGQVMGLRVGAVKARVFHGREKLRRILKRYVESMSSLETKQRVVKNRIASIVLLIAAFLCHPNVIRAQAQSNGLTSEPPVLPMNIEFRYVPQYFEQSFTDDQRYARIEALVDDGRCDVILLDKTTGREAFYSTSSRKVDGLTAGGADAYVTRIDFRASSTIDSYPLFLIHFHDQFGQEVTWQFVAGDIVSHASPEIITHTGDAGISLLYAPHRATAAAGTTLTIADRKYVPIPTQSIEVLGAFYATDMTVSEILPGTDLWTVEDSPANVAQTARWNLGGDGGRQRVLEVKEASDTEATVQQTDVNDSDAAQVVLNIVRENDTYGLRSISFQSHGNTLWIFFGSVLPFPARKIDDKTTVAFTVAENEQATVASGELEVQRAVRAEHLLWRFDTPNPAKNATFETGVNLIPSGGDQMTCVNAPQTPDCVEP
jgi:hypothetical protein